MKNSHFLYFRRILSFILEKISVRNCLNYLFNIKHVVNEECSDNCKYFRSEFVFKVNSLLFDQDSLCFCYKVKRKCLFNDTSSNLLASWVCHVSAIHGYAFFSEMKKTKNHIFFQFWELDHNWMQTGFWFLAHLAF